MNEAEKYQALLRIVKCWAKSSCCPICDCRSCDAEMVLRLIGENDET